MKHSFQEKRTAALIKKIATLIMAKRREGGLGVRAAAAKSGVSAATLSRLERGISSDLPDTGTLTKLATWFGMSLADLLTLDDAAIVDQSPEPTTPEFVEVHLRADKNLSPKTAEALAKMFKVLYNQSAKPPPT